MPLDAAKPPDRSQPPVPAQGDAKPAISQAQWREKYQAQLVPPTGAAPQPERQGQPSWGDRHEANRRPIAETKAIGQPAEHVAGPIPTGDAMRNELNKQFANNPQMPLGASFTDGPQQRDAVSDTTKGGGRIAEQGLGTWDTIKVAGQMLLGFEKTRFVGGMVDKATGVAKDTATAVKDVYGPNGMLQKAAEKMADKAAGIQRPDEYYCSKEDSDRYLKAIVTIGATTMPELKLSELKIPPGVSPEFGWATAGGERGALAGHGAANPEALFSKAQRAGDRVGPDGVYQTTKNLAKGNAGERLATESLAADGHKVLSYKPDILGTNQGGIDLVTMKDGKVYLIDNKAFQSAGNINDVSSLTTNLKKNVDAVKDQFTQFAADKSRPAAERKMYAEAATALKNDQYVKAITNASMTAADGQMKTGVSEALRSRGIDFINVYPGKTGGH